MPASVPAEISLEGSGEAEMCLEAATRQEDKRCEGCVDLYYRAALVAWRRMELVPALSACNPAGQAAWQIYQRSIERLLATACRYRRIDPRGQLVIADGAARRVVPIEYYGFAWKPCEFSQVLPTDDLPRKDLQHYFRTCGLGVPLVAVRHGCGEEPFYREKQPFPVTAVLRPQSGGHAREFSGRPEAVLAFYNPCLCDSLQVGPSSVALARDLSAPFAYLLREAPRRFTEGFLNPDDASVKQKLLMMEPYQRGKVPVVFIHGLWSDPMTWVDTVNELRVQSDLYRRCQFWFFQYPTGGELLDSAAILREQLLSAREQFDPQHQDPAMQQMVLVGHSMGGLVAQLEVTYAYDILWQHAAHQPLECVRASPAVRWQLRRDFYFDPSPLVKRVVFIATPHRGSGMSRRLIGRAASSLVQYSPQEKAQYRQLMDNNRDIFREYLWDARPTTVDLLEPSNPMLAAMARMPFGRCIQLHSIIGTGGMTLTGEPSDGVVPVSSARQAEVCSELFVSDRHARVHRNPAAVAELMRILREHVSSGGVPLR